MTPEVKELLAGIPITEDGKPPSLELIEIIQRMADAIRDLQSRVEALEP